MKNYIYIYEEYEQLRHCLTGGERVGKALKWGLVIAGIIFLALGIADLVVLSQLAAVMTAIGTAAGTAGGGSISDTITAFATGIGAYTQMFGIVAMWRAIFEIIVGIVAIVVVIVKRTS